MGAAGALVLLTLVTYRPALDAGFVWDDDDYVTANEALRTRTGLRRIWTELGVVPQYYPLTFTSLWIDYQAWGLEPRGYHATNVALHALNALLVWRILAYLAVPGAWLAAAIFAVHPVHVESVVWITERKNVLSGAFYLSSLLAFLHLFLGAETTPRRRLYVLGTLLFAGALLAKTVTASLPVVLLLVLWWKRGRVGWHAVAALMPLVALGTAAGLLTIWLERHNVGAVGAPWELSVVERCLIAGRALWFYLRKLAWPDRLTFNYPRWNVDAAVWWHYLFPAAAAAAVALLWTARPRLGRGPLVAVLFFAVTLAPALGFVNVFPMRYSFVADHFQYLASLGPIALASAGTAVALGRWGASLAGTLALAALAALVWRQVPAYADARTLWLDTLTKNPDSAMAHNNLGVILLAEGRGEDAAAHFREALRIAPDDVLALNNLGSALLLQGRVQEATARFRDALGVAPGDASVRVNLGTALAATGHSAEAIVHYTEAIRIEPGSPVPYTELASLLLAQGRVDEAIDRLRVAVRLAPDDAEVHQRLGRALAAAGRVAEAAAAAREAQRLTTGRETAPTGSAPPGPAHPPARTGRDPRPRPRRRSATPRRTRGPRARRPGRTTTRRPR
jgi:Flp pilus assembly protein TadD